LSYYNYAAKTKQLQKTNTQKSDRIILHNEKKLNGVELQ